MILSTDRTTTETITIRDSIIVNDLDGVGDILILISYSRINIFSYPKFEKVFEKSKKNRQSNMREI